MPSKNNVSTLRKKQGETAPVLPTHDQDNFSDVVEEVTKPRKKKQIGRPKKNPAEKRDYKITISLTQAEGKKIKEKAGLAGEATYLYAMLEQNGEFK